MTKVKVCGITSLRDAWLSIEAGADALGFVFWAASPRRATALEARAIIRTLPPLTAVVGVFVDESAEVINETAAFCKLSFAQLHGNEDPGILKKLTVPVIRAVSVGGRKDVVQSAGWKTPLFLFDAKSSKSPGGTGKQFALSHLKAVPSNVRYFLAGGLTPGNVAASVRKVRPFGVDVSTGVEREPGVKDPAKLRKFIRAAKLA